MHTEYKSSVIQELRDQQIRFAPRQKKVDQALRAERLLTELDPTRTYTYEYVCFRITDFRPDGIREVMPGEDLLHDLRLFIEDVTDAADLQVEEVPETVYTVDDLSEKFNVSSKTISRWRRQGLVSRRFIFGNRRRVGFLKSSVDRFVDHNRNRIQRGERFSQMTDQERMEIISRARRFSDSGNCPSEISRLLAEHFGRSVETIRYTLRHHDTAHPEDAIFPQEGGRLTADSKRQLYEQYRRGTTAAALAKRYFRTKSTIHRIVNEVRAELILELPMDYMHNEEFNRRGADKRILGPMPEVEKPARKVRVPQGLPSYLMALYEVPLLNREQEQHLFRKFNYIKHKANRSREKLDRLAPRASLMDEIEELYGQAVAMKNMIVQANLRLVVSIAKRHMAANEDFFSLVSDGNVSLMRAIEKFDYSRGNKFSTYASWAIMKNFARTIPYEHRQLDRFRTSLDELFSGQQDRRSNQMLLESAQLQRELQVGSILSRLDDREQKIIISRFGLDHSREPQTLKEVGVEMGVTKERVRQIEARALNKLRQAVRDASIDLLE
ncbi:MAG: sigma-70 family RNA polymerase sigma factor [Planctomycetota bacterium]|nr:sigma-70 family RNA polymerase sigma factor [Planctomycetota bacterium]